MDLSYRVFRRSRISFLRYVSDQLVAISYATYLKDTIITSLRLFVFFCAANMAGPTKVVTVQPGVAALLSLHWIVPR